MLFVELDFINSFHIPVRQFVAYFHALELGYRQNPCKPNTFFIKSLTECFYPRIICAVVTELCSFELIGTPVTSALGNLHTSFGFSALFRFRLEAERHVSLIGNAYIYLV